MHAVDKALGGVEIYAAEDHRLENLSLGPVPVARAGHAASTAPRQSDLRRLVVVVADSALIDGVRAGVVEGVVQCALVTVRPKAAGGTVRIIDVTIGHGAASRTCKEISLSASAHTEASDDRQRRELRSMAILCRPDKQNEFAICGQLQFTLEPHHGEDAQVFGGSKRSEKAQLSERAAHVACSVVSESKQERKRVALTV